MNQDERLVWVKINDGFPLVIMSMKAFKYFATFKEQFPHIKLASRIEIDHYLGMSDDDK